MISPDTVYRNMVEHILSKGELRPSRAGNTIQVFGYQAVFEHVDHNFPLLSTKKINFDNVYHELCWFLRGEVNLSGLKAPQLWESWADKNGELGPIYGYQWRNWNDGNARIDQIQDLIDGIKKDPTGRRHIVTAWNPADISKMALPPCHCFFQCNVRKGQFLDLHLYQRSADTAIGVPYNIASYATLMIMLAQECNLQAGSLTHSFGDLHIYEHHVEKLKQQLTRPPKEACQLRINYGKTLDQLAEDDDMKDALLLNYDPHPFVKFELNV